LSDCTHAPTIHHYHAVKNPGGAEIPSPLHFWTLLGQWSFAISIVIWSPIIQIINPATLIEHLVETKVGSAIEFI